jgi:glycosyltransferase involved in cell wall biosynthesis
MACGCPPIAMAAGGIPEILADPSLGWLVEVDDQKSFLAAMRIAAALPAETRADIARNARQRVTTHFSAKSQYTLFANSIEGGRQHATPAKPVR